MVPVIRIDEQVMNAIKRKAIELDLVFESPNTTLRKVLGLDIQQLPKEPVKPVLEAEPERVVSYFLTIHQPLPKEQPRDGDDNGIWVNKELRHRHWVDEIKEGDIVFVYEVKTTKRPGFVEENGRLKPSHEPRGGIVSCFKVGKNNQEAGQGTYEGNEYIREYVGDNVNLSRKYIELAVLEKEWEKATGSAFNPRTPGGIRLLSEEQYRCLAKLMGVQI